MILERLRKVARYAVTDPEFVAAFSGSQLGLQLQVVRPSGVDTVLVQATVKAEVMTLRASPEVWELVAQPVPEVGFHSFTALRRQDADFQISGTERQVAQSLHALERLFELIRGQWSMQREHVYPDLSAIRGFYAPVKLADGSVTSVYVEQAGNPDASPLLMLHTAGADSRQFHPLMTDPRLLERWNLMAFDLPGHGRSMPLHDALWQDARLTKANYLAMCCRFIEQVVRQPATVMGCSMGAAMALLLAREHPKWVSAVIALEAPFRAKGRRQPWLTHPEVNQSAHNPSYVRGLMSPASPLFWRRVATWIYSQGGFGIYAGDLSFYSDEFDAEQDLQDLDGRNCPITLLTGSYDYSATPVDSARVAAMIPGSRFIEMPDLGHFPMIENPSLLLRYLQPELERIWTRLNEHER